MRYIDSLITFSIVVLVLGGLTVAWQDGFSAAITECANGHANETVSPCAQVVYGIWYGGIGVTVGALGASIAVSRGETETLPPKVP